MRSSRRLPFPVRGCVGFERGGHLLIAVEQPRIRAEVQAFIRSHSAQQGEQQAPGPGK
jgi:hypothetical protein